MRSLTKFLCLLLTVVTIMSVGGSFATWCYSEWPVLDASTSTSVALKDFDYPPPEILKITKVELVASQGASGVGVNHADPTFVNTTVNSYAQNSSVTYRVTVWNNTSVTYWYQGPTWLVDYESNNLIGQKNGITITTKDLLSDTSATFNNDDWVPPHTTREFYLTIGFGSNAVGSYISNLIDLRFGIHMDAVYDGFLAILNDKISANGYNYLAEVFNQRYKDNKTTTIANIGQDQEIFDRLFGGELYINIDGVKTPVTVMIRRDNVDNRQTGDDYNSANSPTGCEYTIYISTSPLTSPATVYAVSYSNGGVGAQGDTWYQLGELYEGTAPLTTDPNTGKTIFDYSKWIATAKEYEFVDGKSYKVGYDQGDQYDKLKTLEQLMSAADQDVFNDIDNSGILRKVYSIVNSSANKDKPGIDGLRMAFEDAKPFYNIYNNGQEVKVKRESTRAEILPYMIAIQHALDYYNQVNP